MSVLNGYDDWARTTTAGVTRLTNMQLSFQCGTGPWTPGAALTAAFTE